MKVSELDMVDIEDALNHAFKGFDGLVGLLLSLNECSEPLDRSIQDRDLLPLIISLISGGKAEFWEELRHSIKSKKQLQACG